LPVYVAASAVGPALINLAQIAGVRRLIYVVGKRSSPIGALIDEAKGDVIIDYRIGLETVPREIKEAFTGRKLEYAFDAVS
jgi:NADPH:quinone reductase